MGGLSRRDREKRAYGLTLATGGLSLGAVVTLVLGVVGVTSLGLFFLLLVAAVVSGLALRSTLNPRR
jgi:hypothetical protein